MTNLRAGNPRNRGSIPSRTPKHAAAFFPEVQRPGHEIDYVPAFSTEINNVWSYNAISLPTWHAQGQPYFYVVAFIVDSNRIWTAWFSTRIFCQLPVCVCVPGVRGINRNYCPNRWSP